MPEGLLVQTESIPRLSLTAGTSRSLPLVNGLSLIYFLSAE